MSAHLDELQRLLKEATPGTWHTCNPNCSCRRMSGDHYPIAKFEDGEWGDEFAALRAGEDGKPEAFMRRIPYGRLAEGMGEANLRTTVTLHNAAPWMIELLREAARLLTQAASHPGMAPGHDWYDAYREVVAKLEKGP